MKKQEIKIKLDESNSSKIKKVFKNHIINNIIFAICWLLLIIAIYFPFKNFGEKYDIQFLLGEVYVYFSYITAKLLFKLSNYITESNLKELLNFEEIIKEVIDDENTK